LFNWCNNGLVGTRKMKKKEILAEQYLEVCLQDDETWSVELVIENVKKSNNKNAETMRYCLASFETMEEGDNYANAMRFYYDKTIFEYELM